jgi:hypothetical protein
MCSHVYIHCAGHLNKNFRHRHRDRGSTQAFRDRDRDRGSTQAFRDRDRDRGSTQAFRDSDCMHNIFMKLAWGRRYSCIHMYTYSVLVVHKQITLLCQDHTMVKT